MEVIVGFVVVFGDLTTFFSRHFLLNKSAGGQTVRGGGKSVHKTTHTGKRLDFDVRTVNVLCASARTSPESQCSAIETGKNRHYRKYYGSFAPFVTTLSGAVSEA